MSWAGNSYAYDGTGTGLEDDHGHSHAVAGLIGARDDNGVGLKGLANEALIVPYKALSGGWGQWKWFENCLKQFADTEFPGYEFKVLNASLGSSAAPESTLEAIKYATNKGVIVVTSAGNPGNDKPVTYPGAYEEWVITAGAIDRNDNIASFTPQGDSVDVANYGVGVYTHNNKQGYWYVSGTSFSSPLTAGVIALVLNHHRDYFIQFKGKELRDKVEEYLQRLADDINASGFDLFTGWGVPRVRKLIESDPREILDTPGKLVPPQLLNPANGQTTEKILTFEWSKVDAAIQYEMLVSLDDKFTQVVNGYRGPNLSYKANLPTIGTYYWKVRSVNDEISEWSETWSFHTKEETLEAPQLISPREGEQLDGLTLVWNSVAGATSYDIQIAEDINFSSIVKTYNTSRTILEDEMSVGTYYWRVRAKNATVVSPFSMVRSFTITKREEYPTRTFKFILGNYNIWYSGQSSGSIIASSELGSYVSGVNVNSRHSILNIDELTVSVESDLSFDDTYAAMSSAIKRFFTNRGLALKINDAKAAHEATIIFLNLLIKREFPTFAVIELKTSDKGREQV